MLHSRLPVKNVARQNSTKAAEAKYEPNMLCRRATLCVRYIQLNVAEAHLDVDDIVKRFYERRQVTTGRHRERDAKLRQRGANPSRGCCK